MISFSIFNLFTFILCLGYILSASAAPVPSPKPLSVSDAFDKFTDIIDPLRKGLAKVAKPVGDFLSDKIIDPLTGDSTKFVNKVKPTSLAAPNVDELVAPALFSNAAYCSPDVVKAWKCGPTCDKLPGVEVFLTGGNNQDIPWFFIAHDPNSKSIIVATQGTEPTSIGSITVDLTLGQVPVNKTLFPNAPDDVKVHSGFQKAFEANADFIRNEVVKRLAEKKVDKVLVTGHSLGGAASVLNAVHLRLSLPKEVSIQTTTFGLPRGGNTAWAKFVDQTLGVGSQFVHMHVGKDIVPTIPPRTFFDYHHPSGEIFDSLSGDGPVNCPGQENDNCSAGNNVLEKSIIDHLGPYAGVKMGTFACAA